MDMNKHIIFVGSRPEIFNLLNKNQSPQFKVYYTMEISNTVDLLDGIALEQSVYQLIFLVVDVQFNYLEELLRLINKNYKEAFSALEAFNVSGYLYVPAVDLSNLDRLEQLLNRILSLNEFSLEEVLGRTVDFNKFQNFIHNFLRQPQQHLV